MASLYKKMSVAILALILFSVGHPLIASAHSQVESSVPSDGETVEESIDTITVEFSAGIEGASTLTLFNQEDEEVPVEVNVEASSLEVRSEQPLENGEYRAVYSIMSEDTHPVEGEFTFTVNAEQAAEEETPVVEEEQEEAVEAPDTETADSEEESSGSSLIWIFVVVVVAGLATGIIRGMRKRK